MSSGYLYLIIAGLITAGFGAVVVAVKMARKSAYAQGAADQRAKDLVEINRLKDEARQIREDIDAGKIKVGPDDL